MLCSTIIGWIHDSWVIRGLGREETFKKTGKDDGKSGIPDFSVEFKKVNELFCNVLLTTMRDAF